MSEKSEAKSFLDKDGKAWRAREEWQPAAEAFFKPWPEKRRVMEWRRSGENIVDLGYDFEEYAETINQLHGVDFLNDVIPKLIEKISMSGVNRKVKILDMGCGLGFFNDQIRAKFGDKVEVYGTGINKANLKKRKAAIIKDIRSGKIIMPESDREEILSETDGNLHPNDAKWNSVEELSDFPEFDLIIDSEGEMIYAGGTGAGFFPKGDSTQTKLQCAIKKLNPGGQLFIYRIHKNHKGITPERRQWLEDTYGVIIEDNEAAHFSKALKITKATKR